MSLRDSGRSWPALEMVKNCVEFRPEHPHYALEQYLSRNTVDTGLP